MIVSPGAIRFASSSIIASGRRAAGTISQTARGGVSAGDEVVEVGRPDRPLRRQRLDGRRLQVVDDALVPAAHERRTMLAPIRPSPIIPSCIWSSSRAGRVPRPRIRRAGPSRGPRRSVRRVAPTAPSAAEPSAAEPSACVRGSIAPCPSRRGGSPAAEDRVTTPRPTAARPMGAAELLRSVGLMADGPVTWGRPVPSAGPGVYIVEWPEPLEAAPVELTLVGKWLERLPGCAWTANARRRAKWPPACTGSGCRTRRSCTSG